MSEINSQLRDFNNNNIYPRTYADCVMTRDGKDLSAVEPGSQVNKIEIIKVNGSELLIYESDKSVNIDAVSNETFNSVNNETQLLVTEAINSNNEIKEEFNTALKDIESSLNLAKVYSENAKASADEAATIAAEVATETTNEIIDDLQSSIAEVKTTADTALQLIEDTGLAVVDGLLNITYEEEA